MHLAKGLESRAVAVITCDDEVVPCRSTSRWAGDPADPPEFYETERHLPYIACTRARDFLPVSSKTPGSGFLDDMRKD